MWKVPVFLPDLSSLIQILLKYEVNDITYGILAYPKPFSGESVDQRCLPSIDCSREKHRNAVVDV
ncbi:hypothetical protein HanXRQr2_MTg0834581 (mitochondrion) [Helianthus annuus]|jgi:hypothetical protein|uniref:Uncharacterized protein n=1 Tax=Helianthus annuus TaxID=4232 RepID=A0A9K3DFX1_HELAN|nr:hypothetical protein HanXRQr2_MTg0834581 [Helianthus annuus]